MMMAACALLASCGNKAQNADENTAVAEQTAATTEAVADAQSPFFSPDGSVHELTDAQMYAPGVSVPNLTVLDFNADYCLPCRRLAPVLAELAGKYEGQVTFVSIDTEVHPDLFEAYNVGNAIPVVLFLKPDGSREHFVGIGELLPQEKFDQLIQNNLQ